MRNGAVDLTLDAEVRVWRRPKRVGDEQAPVNPALEEFNANALIDRYTEPFGLLVGQLAYEGKGGPELAYRFERFGK